MTSAERALLTLLSTASAIGNTIAQELSATQSPTLAPTKAEPSQSKELMTAGISVMVLSAAMAVCIFCYRHNRNNGRDGIADPQLDDYFQQPRAPTPSPAYSDGLRTPPPPLTPTGRQTPASPPPGYRPRSPSYGEAIEEGESFRSRSPSYGEALIIRPTAIRLSDNVRGVRETQL